MAPSGGGVTPNTGTSAPVLLAKRVANIANLPPITSSLKGRGRLIYRAWAESKGLAVGAAMRAIDKATTTFMARNKTTAFRKAA